MSAVPAPPAPPPVRFSAARLFGAAVFAGAGLFVAVFATAALGYGRDVHLLRAAVLCFGLLFGFLVAGNLVASVRPLGAPGGRAAIFLGLVMVMAALVRGATAWLIVPCRPGGSSLIQAAMKRDVLKAWTDMPIMPATENAAALKREFDSLAADFPSMANGLRPDIDRWAKSASAIIGERFQQTSPDDIETARELQAKATALGEAFPTHRERLDSDFHEWLTSAVLARRDELDAIGPSDWAEFDRTADGRHDLASVFPDSRQYLDSAEGMWVMQATAVTTAPVVMTLSANPRQARQVCLEVDKQILALKTLDRSPNRFRNARANLFTIAQAAAREEVRKHIEANRYDLAFNVAVSHAVEWFATASLLGAEEVHRVESLRESCRYLTRLQEQAGGPPEPAPEPRTSELAPPPREKS